MSKVIYILADNRSGSTLLDQLLGAHPKIVSLGEVHHLAAYVLKDRRLYDPVHPLDCSCGQSLRCCPFWTAVAAQLEGPFEVLRLRPRFLGREAESGTLGWALRRVPRLIINRAPTLFLNPLVAQIYGKQRLGRDSFSLFDAITKVTRSEYLVDSSKSAFRFRALYETAPPRVFGIHLLRDYRATVYSKMKRGQSMDAGVHEWITRIRQTNLLTADVPSERLLRIRYEDLCTDPRVELRRVCDFLGLEFSEKMLSRPVEEVHHIGGSPSKFDPARKGIELDLSYLNSFSRDELTKMHCIAGDVASEYGYD